MVECDARNQGAAEGTRALAASWSGNVLHERLANSRAQHSKSHPILPFNTIASQRQGFRHDRCVNRSSQRLLPLTIARVDIREKLGASYVNMSSGRVRCIRLPLMQTVPTYTQLIRRVTCAHSSPIHSSIVTLNAGSSQSWRTIDTHSAAHVKHREELTRRSHTPTTTKRQPTMRGTSIGAIFTFTGTQLWRHGGHFKDDVWADRPPRRRPCPRHNRPGVVAHNRLWQCEPDAGRGQE